MIRIDVDFLHTEVIPTYFIFVVNIFDVNFHYCTPLKVTIILSKIEWLSPIFSVVFMGDRSMKNNEYLIKGIVRDFRSLSWDKLSPIISLMEKLSENELYIVGWSFTEMTEMDDEQRHRILQLISKSKVQT
jgi:hypothetical protein